GGAAGLEPAVHTVGAADAIFHITGAAPRHRIGPKSPGRLSVVRVQHRQPAPAQQIRLGHAGGLRPLRTEVVAGAVGRGAPDELRQRLGQIPPTPLALPQLLLGLSEVVGTFGLNHLTARTRWVHKITTTFQICAWRLEQSMANLLLIDDDPDLLAERVAHLFP